MSGLVYQCWSCGNLVELLVLGGWRFGAPLKLLGPGRDGSREKDEPPLDLLPVVIDGKSFWEYSESGERYRVSDRMQAREGDSAGLSAF